MSEAEFKTWAIVEVMGHVEYAGFVTAETIAGSAMLRVDVPEVKDRTALTEVPCDRGALRHHAMLGGNGAREGGAHSGYFHFRLMTSRARL